MSETTTDEMYDSYRRGQVWAIGTGDTAREKFDAWLAEVERAAAEKALTDAVDDWESGTVEHDEIKHTSDAPLGWGDGSVVDAVMASGPVMTWLRKRAAAYRREETE